MGHDTMNDRITLIKGITKLMQDHIQTVLFLLHKCWCKLSSDKEYDRIIVNNNNRQNNSKQ